MNWLEHAAEYASQGNYVAAALCLRAYNELHGFTEARD